VLTGYVRERGEEESGDGVHLFFSWAPVCCRRAKRRSLHQHFTGLLLLFLHLNVCLCVWCSSDFFKNLRRKHWRFFFWLQEIVSFCKGVISVVANNAFVMMFMAAERKDVKFWVKSPLSKCLEIGAPIKSEVFRRGSGDAMRRIWKKAGGTWGKKHMGSSNNNKRKNRRL
jgi:hypothetical protein